MKQLLRRAKTQHLYAVPSTNLGLRFVPAATLQYYPRAKIESLVVVVVVKLGKDTLVKFFFTRNRLATRRRLRHFTYLSIYYDYFRLDSNTPPQIDSNSRVFTLTFTLQTTISLFLRSL